MAGTTTPVQKDQPSHLPEPQTKTSEDKPSSANSSALGEHSSIWGWLREGCLAVSQNSTC